MIDCFIDLSVPYQKVPGHHMVPCSTVCTSSICIMSTWGVSDLSRVPRARSARGRVDKSGTPQIDMIQMACIPNLLGRRIRIFTTTIDTNTFSLV